MSHPAPLKLYGFGPSRSFRALWALEETGLAFEHIETVLRKDGSQANSGKHRNRELHRTTLTRIETNANLSERPRAL